MSENEVLHTVESHFPRLKSYTESGELVWLVVYTRACLSVKKPLHRKLIEGRKEIHADTLPAWSWCSTFRSTAA